jgi:hypothetical protein
MKREYRKFVWIAVWYGGAMIVLALLLLVR